MSLKAISNSFKALSYVGSYKKIRDRPYRWKLFTLYAVYVSTLILQAIIRENLFYTTIEHPPW